MRISNDEKIIPCYETLRRHALFPFEQGGAVFSADLLQTKGFLSWAQYAKNRCEYIAPVCESAKGSERMDEGLKAVLTDLALRAITQEDA